MQRDDLFQIIGKLRPMLRHALGKGVALKVMRVAHVIDSGQQRAEKFAVVRNAADRDAAEIDAMIAALAADQPRLGSFATRPLISDGDL